MSDPNNPRNFDVAEPATGDPDQDSTWSTIDGTADIDELVNEEDFANFLVEPIRNPLTGQQPTDVPDEP
jgi:hypothetical protein